ncbi:MAG: extracellular solute-binding protein [Christensenellales bacterium]|jgi:putative aldouronate transport system substrate-binding protein
MKKLVALLLSLFMLVSLGTALAEEQVSKTLTVLHPKSPLVEDYDTNAFILWLEETTGIDVNWMQIPASSFADKVNAIIMSGDLPDVINWPHMPRTIQQQWADEGIIIALDNLIDEYGVHTKRLFEEQPGTDDFIRLADGKIYAMPTYSDIIHVNYTNRFFINTEFLAALGMETPTTLDEFYKYLVGVRDQDVNGNGDPSDEIPMAAMANWGTDQFTFIMNCFLFYDFKNPIDIDENGVIHSVLDNDAFREGLTFMNKLYEEGLLYENVNLDSKGVVALGESGDGYAIVGCHPGTLASGGVEGGEIYHQYEAISPLEGPSGLRQTPWYRYVNIREGAWMITSACDDVQTAFELGDFLYSYDSTMRLRHGEFGTSWVLPNEGELTIDGRQATFKELIAYSSDVQNLHLDNDLMFYETRGVFLDDGVFGAISTDLKDAINRQWLMSENTKKYMVPYGREVVPTVTIPSDMLDEYSTITTDMNTYYKEWMAHFLIGEADIKDDATWEEYVQGLKDLGIERYLEIYNKAYEASPLKWGN